MVLLLCSMAAGSFSRWNENSLKWENRPLKQKWPVVTLDNHTSVQTTMTSRPPIKRQQNRSHTNVTIAYPVARVINAIITWAEEADGANAYFYSLWANTNYSNVIWAVVIVVVLHVVTLPYSVSPPSSRYTLINNKSVSEIIQLAGVQLILRCVTAAAAQFAFSSVLTIQDRGEASFKLGHCTRSPIFSHFKNKYDLTLCQSGLHTASETFVCHKKIRISLDFLRFRIRSMHLDRKGWGKRKNARENLGLSVQWS